MLKMLALHCRAFGKIFHPEVYSEIVNDLKIIRMSHAHEISEWAKVKDYDVNHLVFIIHSLKKEKMFNKIKALFPYLKKYDKEYFSAYLSLTLIDKQHIEYSEVFSNSIFEILMENCHVIEPYLLATAIRTLPRLKISTIKKFELIDRVTPVFLQNFENFKTIDRAYFIQGIFKLPSENSHNIFIMCAIDTQEKGLLELSNLCNYLSMNQIEGYMYLFGMLEDKAINNPDFKYVLIQVVHSFSKVGKGSAKFGEYCLKEFQKHKNFETTHSIGVFIVSILKFKNLKPETIIEINEIYQEIKGKLSQKYISLVEKLLNELIN
jgi:hypothetical protein